MATQLTEIAGIGSTTAHILKNHGFKTVKSIADATIGKLSAVPGFSAARAQKTIDAAKKSPGSTASKPNTVTTVKESSRKKVSKDKKSKNKKNRKDKKLKSKKKSDKNTSRDKKKNKKKSDKNKRRDKKKNKKNKRKK